MCITGNYEGQFFQSKNVNIIDDLDFMKIINYFSVKDSQDNEKTSHWEKIFIKDISDKRLLYQ